MKREPSEPEGDNQIVPHYSRDSRTWDAAAKDFFLEPKAYVKRHGLAAYQRELGRQLVDIASEFRAPKPRKWFPKKPVRANRRYQMNIATWLGLLIVAQILYMILKFGTLVPP